MNLSPSDAGSALHAVEAAERRHAAGTAPPFAATSLNLREILEGGGDAS